TFFQDAQLPVDGTGTAEPETPLPQPLGEFVAVTGRLAEQEEQADGQEGPALHQSGLHTPTIYARGLQPGNPYGRLLIKPRPARPAASRRSDDHQPPTRGCNKSMTSATSLSPRPDMVRRTVVPQGSSSVPAARMTHASAWDGSSAGMIPSVAAI